MNNRSVTHATFTIERSYDAPPQRVFAAFADPKIKARWFAAPEDWDRGTVTMDFRVGGHEINSGGPKGGPVHSFNAVYQDIVANERIIYSYDMHLDDKRISVSLATIEFQRQGKGTRLVLTEQGAFLDGWDKPDERERGTRELLDALGRELERQTTAA
jgi:uncharacterized protein YndB with AHSA1/START domain